MYRYNLPRWFPHYALNVPEATAARIVALLATSTEGLEEGSQPLTAGSSFTVTSDTREEGTRNLFLSDCSYRRAERAGLTNGIQWYSTPLREWGE